jgi:hypothetical protein
MYTTSDFKVQIETFEGPDNWPKWKWQILMLLHVHCLEGITDDLESALSCLQMLSLSRKRNSPSGNRMTPKLQALLHARYSSLLQSAC